MAQSKTKHRIAQQRYYWKKKLETVADEYFGDNDDLQYVKLYTLIQKAEKKKDFTPIKRYFQDFKDIFNEKQTERVRELAAEHLLSSGIIAVGTVETFRQKFFELVPHMSSARAYERAMETYYKYGPETALKMMEIMGGL